MVDSSPVPRHSKGEEGESGNETRWFPGFPGNNQSTGFNTRKKEACKVGAWVSVTLRRKRHVNWVPG